MLLIYFHDILLNVMYNSMLLINQHKSAKDEIIQNIEDEKNKK